MSDDPCSTLVIEKVGEISTAMVDIIIPVFNQVDVTRECIESIFENTKDVCYRLIVINNASTDPKMIDYLISIIGMNPSHEGDDCVMVLNLRENVRWVGGINQGLKLAKAPYVLLMNNDTTISKNDHFWLKRMLGHIVNHEDVGAVGPTSNFVLTPQLGTWSLSDYPIHHETNLLSGFCILLSLEAIEDAGVLDERFMECGNDDLDYCIRLGRAGYRLIIARDVYIEHIGAQTFRSEIDSISRVDVRGRELLIDKWGLDTVDELLRLEPKMAETLKEVGDG